MTPNEFAKPAIRDPPAHKRVPTAKSLISLYVLDKMENMKDANISPAVKDVPSHEY
jgi:hypothetical protein